MINDNLFSIQSATKENPIVFFECLPEKGNFDRSVVRYKAIVLRKVEDMSFSGFAKVEFDEWDYVWKISLRRKLDNYREKPEVSYCKLENAIANELEYQYTKMQESMRSVVGMLTEEQVTFNVNDYVLKLALALNRLYSLEEFYRFFETFRGAYSRAIDFIVREYGVSLSAQIRALGESSMVINDIPIVDDEVELSPRICDDIVDFKLTSGESLFEIDALDRARIATRWKTFFYNKLEDFDGIDPILINTHTQIVHFIIDNLAKAVKISIPEIEKRKVFQVKGKPLTAQSIYSSRSRDKVSDDIKASIREMFAAHSKRD